ncbi:b(0,+)-type amino acid transporter 1 [Caerostris extrusa]|uniref:B(0,+)-type amino acid transporter 1 n=1 Tax=Caerostris extrusa TaxID=172846 RepID=A0AAV4N4U4_CAEEX|nr:b(0,+)-type amino acid transporter 1 [Caerostris extrusa]
MSLPTNGLARFLLDYRCLSLDRTFFVLSLGLMDGNYLFPEATSERGGWDKALPDLPVDGKRPVRASPQDGRGLARGQPRRRDRPQEEGGAAQRSRPHRRNHDRFWHLRITQRCLTALWVRWTQPHCVGRMRDLVSSRCPVLRRVGHNDHQVRGRVQLHDGRVRPPASLSFLVGSVLVLKPSMMAIICLSLAEYVIEPLHVGCRPDVVSVKLVAALSIGIITYINCLSVKLATRIQNFFTAAKLLAIAIIVVGGSFKLMQGHTEHLATGFEGSHATFSDIATAFYSGLWAYDGWNNLNYVTEELKNPYSRGFPLKIGTELYLSGISMFSKVLILVVNEGSILFQKFTAGYSHWHPTCHHVLRVCEHFLHHSHVVRRAAGLRSGCSDLGTPSTRGAVLRDAHIRRTQHFRSRKRILLHRWKIVLRGSQRGSPSGHPVVSAHSSSHSFPCPHIQCCPGDLHDHSRGHRQPDRLLQLHRVALLRRHFPGAHRDEAHQERAQEALQGSHRHRVRGAPHLSVPGGGSHRAGPTDRVPLRLHVRAIGLPRLHSLRALQAQPQRHGKIDRVLPTPPGSGPHQIRARLRRPTFKCDRKVEETESGPRLKGAKFDDEVVCISNQPGSRLPFQQRTLMPPEF